MRVFDVWWLPGYQPGSDTAWYEIRGVDAVARAPRLTPGDIAEVCRYARAQRDAYLRRLSVDEIAHRIAAAVNRWLDPFSPYLHLAEQFMPAFTGYPPEAVRKGLAGYLASFRLENLRRLLRDELGDPEILDGFRPRLAAAGLTRALGPGLVVHSFAGNVPGLPGQSLVAATLVKAASLGKVASDEPGFGALFARSLADVDPRLAACLAVTYWPGDDAASADAAFGQADVVVAYGGETAIDAVRGHVRSGKRLLAYGHKLSFGALAREALLAERLDDLAERAAYDVARFDQQGCLSPHLFYVEEGGEVGAESFARALGAALERWSAAVPRGRVSSDERARIAGVRREHEFRAATGSGAAFGGDEFAVLLDPDPSFAASCLNRVVWVKPLRDLEDLPALLTPVSRYLQTAGVAVEGRRGEALAEVLAEAGLDRICPVGQMGDPPVTWHHDGRFNLVDFLRFTDLEPESGAGRWEFAHPEAGVLGLARGGGRAGQSGSGRRDGSR